MTNQENDFPKLPAPALRALNGAGYYRLEQLSGVSKAELGRLHGVGPKAFGSLEKALEQKDLTFRG